MYLQKVGEAAPNTPMFYYHIPIMTGVKFSMEDLLQAAATDIPTLRGLKFTDENLMEFTRCVACNKGSYPVMYGRDEVRGRTIECTFFLYYSKSWHHWLWVVKQQWVLRIITVVDLITDSSNTLRMVTSNLL